MDTWSIIREGCSEMAKRYTGEFREEAVRLALCGKYTRAQVARDLGVNIWTLKDWVESYRQGHGERSFRTETLEEENSRLRKENERLKQERDILKKAAAYFAKEQL
jgi:transposase